MYKKRNLTYRATNIQSENLNKNEPKIKHRKCQSMKNQLEK